MCRGMHGGRWDAVRVRRHIFHDTSCQHHTPAIGMRSLHACSQENRVKNLLFDSFYFIYENTNFQMTTCLCDLLKNILQFKTNA